MVPNSYMCRRAARAYIETVVGPYTVSNDASGAPITPDERSTGSCLGRPANVISATEHLPAAMAAAAWPTWAT